jgi:TDG/mug DNA glycosylase family protein
VVRTYRPRWVAVFGVGAYRTAFARLNARVGQQDALGDSSVWLLPSPSGANGSYPLVDLIRELRAFYSAVNQS